MPPVCPCVYGVCYGGGMSSNKFRDGSVGLVHREHVPAAHRGYIGTDYFATADDGTRVIEFVDVDPANVRVFYHGGTYHLAPDASDAAS